MNFGFFFFCVVLFLNSVFSEESAAIDFQVKPGGLKHLVFHNRDGAKCVFTYSCQGGTNENWILAINKIKDHTTYGCYVQRKGPRTHSYIFFQKFSLSVEGNVEFHSGEAFKSDEVKLNIKEYFVNKNTKSISQVDGKFESQLNKVVIQYTVLGNSKEL